MLLQYHALLRFGSVCQLLDEQVTLFQTYIAQFVLYIFIRAQQSYILHEIGDSFAFGLIAVNFLIFMITWKRNIKPSNSL